MRVYVASVVPIFALALAAPQKRISFPRRPTGPDNSSHLSKPFRPKTNIMPEALAAYVRFPPVPDIQPLRRSTVTEGANPNCS